MFNGWSTYIFGEQRPPVMNGVGQIVDENNILNEEDDWILVNDEENNENSSDLEVLTMPSSRASSCSSSPLIDWNLTPPSCFERSPSQSHTSSSSTESSSKLGTDLEISIFENLLIEHPSVSVYYRYPRRTVASQLSVKSSSYFDVDVEESKENDDDTVEEEEEELGSITSSNTIVCQRGKSTTGKNPANCLWDTNKSAGNVSLSLIEQQRSASIENNRKLSANRLRRQNSLIRHQTLKKCATKKLRQLP